MTTDNTNALARRSNQDASKRDLIGIASPFRKENGEFPKRVFNADAVKNDLVNLFRKGVMTRVMRPQLGSTANNYVFESRGPLLVARLQRCIRQTISLYEPRIRVLSLSFAEEDTKVTVTILYVVQGVKDSVSVSLEKQGTEKVL